MKIYTKTGDDGTTGLLNGRRVPKDSIRVDAYGSVDELNTIIGLVLTKQLPDEMKEVLETINSLLFSLGSDLAAPADIPTNIKLKRISAENITFLENMIDLYTGQLPPLHNFILPGGSEAGAFLHFARAVCRRAERDVVSLAREEEIGDFVLKFLNRLSDFLFTAARYANYKLDFPEQTWKG